MRPDYPLQTVGSQLIECSDEFIRLLHEGPVDPLLVDTLQRFGQTAPLLIRQHTEDQYQLLAGYPTFQAITSLGIDKTICHVLPLSTPPAYRDPLQILHGLAGPQASPILQAHLLAQASRQVTDSELLGLLSLMGYKPQRYKLDELTALLRLSPSAVLALHHGILASKAGKLLKRLSHDDQDTLIQLINTYRPGGSKQQKLVEMVTELTLRDHKSVHELVREWMPVDHESRQNNGPQRLHELLQYLSALYWPERTRMEKRFQQLVHELHLPEGVTLTPSPAFEDESMEMRLHFTNSEALREKWEKIRAVLQ